MVRVDVKGAVNYSGRCGCAIGRGGEQQASVELASAFIAGLTSEPLMYGPAADGVSGGKTWFVRSWRGATSDGAFRRRRRNQRDQ